MFEGFRLRQERIELERTRVRLITETLSSMGSTRLKRSLEDDDSDRWMSLGSAGARELATADHMTMREQAAKLYYTNTHARNIIRLLEKYVVGRGFYISHKVDLEPVKVWWDEFWKRNKMGMRKKEIVRRLMRDGEVFLRRFKDPDGMIQIRFMNADDITEPQQAGLKAEGDVTYGIETDREDIEKVLAFWYRGVRVPADQVFHRKILVDSDVKRGRSFLEVCMRDLALYRKWLTDRMKLNYIRSLIGLHRKVKGGSADVTNLAAGYETTKLKSPDDTAKMRVPEGVSVITSNEGVDYEFKTPNLQAGDVAEDGRHVLLSIAAGSGMPEHMVTSDASNANFASTLVAEAPGVMEFEDWQDVCEDLFQEIYAAVITSGIEAKKIPTEYDDFERTPSMEEVEVMNPITGEPSKKMQRKVESKKVRKPVPTECMIEFPEIIHRELLAETQAIVLQMGEKLMSKHTAAARLDLDYDEERDRIDQEMEEEGPETGEEPPEDREYEKNRNREMNRGDEEDIEDETGKQRGSKGAEKLPETK